MMTPRDMIRATPGQSVNRDISVPGVALRVWTFMRFGVQGRGKDAIHPTGEIGSYYSRENILYA